MKYSEEDIKLALVAVTQNNESVSEAAKKYNIPAEILENSLLDFKRHITNETILDVHHNGNNPFDTEEINVNNDAFKEILSNQEIISFEKTIEHVDKDNIFQNSSNLVFEDILNKNQEYELTNIIIELHRHFCGMTEFDMRRIIFEYLELNEINHNFDKEIRLISEKFCSQFIQSHPELNNLLLPTNINPQCNFSNDSSSLNDLVVDKFLREYKNEKKDSKNEKPSVFEPSDKATEMKSFEDVCRNEFNVDDFEFSIPCLVKNDETKHHELRLENSNNLIQTKENHHLKIPLVFQNIEDGNLNVESCHAVVLNHEELNQANSNPLQKNGIDDSRLGGSNERTASDIGSRVGISLNHGIVDENSKFLIQSNDENLLSMSQKLDDRDEGKYSVITFEDAMDDISDPLTDGKNQNSISGMHYMNECEEKPVGIGPRGATKLNEENSNSAIESSVAGMAFYNSTISQAFENLESSSNLNVLDFEQGNDQIDSSYQACGGSGISVQNNLLHQSEAKPTHEAAALVSAFPVQNYQHSNIFDSSASQMSADVPFKVEDVNQTNILPEIISGTLRYDSNTADLEKNNCNKNLRQFSDPLAENESMNYSVNFDPIHCEFKSPVGELPLNEIKNLNPDEVSCAKRSNNDAEIIQNSSSAVPVHESHFNFSDGHVADPLALDAATPVVDNSQNSHFSPSELTEKKTECGTLIDKKPHTIRKKKRSKTKGSKLVVSGASKPKKSKYLYKLKSFNGSVLYFTSPTSVSFIKPKITLTKLDESEYLTPPNNGNSPKKGPLLSDSLPIPDEDDVIDSKKLHDACEKHDPSEEMSPLREKSLSEEIFPEISPLKESTPEIPPAEKLFSEISPEKILPETSSQTEIPSTSESSFSKEISPPKEVTPSKDISPSKEISPPKEVSGSLSTKKPEKKLNTTENENTPTFSMQTRKKRLKFLPDGTLVTAKQELEDRILSPSPVIKSRKRPHKNTPQSADKKIKIDSSDDVKPSIPSEIDEIKRKPKPRTPSEPKYIPKYNGPSKKPQKIFDYDSYYREKSNIETPNQPKKLLLPASCEKQIATFKKMKSISESAKSGQLVVNPAQLLSCLLGMPINEDQICTVRFKPPAKQRIPNNRVNVTPSKLASDNSAIKPIAKRQLELLQNNSAFNLFSEGEENSKSSNNFKKTVPDEEKLVPRKS